METTTELPLGNSSLGSQHTSHAVDLNCLQREMNSTRSTAAQKGPRGSSSPNRTAAAICQEKYDPQNSRHQARLWNSCSGQFGFSCSVYRSSKGHIRGQQYSATLLTRTGLILQIPINQTRSSPQINGLIFQIPINRTRSDPQHSD